MCECWLYNTDIGKTIQLMEVNEMLIALSILGYIAVVTLIVGFFKVANQNQLS